MEKDVTVSGGDVSRSMGSNTAAKRAALKSANETLHKYIAATIDIPLGFDGDAYPARAEVVIRARVDGLIDVARREAAQPDFSIDRFSVAANDYIEALRRLVTT